MYSQNEQKLPANAIIMLRFLHDHGRKTQKEIINTLNLPIRSVRYCIRRLMERGLIVKYPNLKDMRSVFYQLAADKLHEVETILEEEGYDVTA
ncbi:MAG: MarR family transcriptional regulator [Methanobacteriota archaeon]|nr:MAG: MarR family transcriptional regulator [Euryarchaeota archaeon]